MLVNVRLIPEDEREIKTIYDNLKQINKDYVNANDLNGDSNGFFYGAESNEESDEENEGQFEDADE